MLVCGESSSASEALLRITAPLITAIRRLRATVTPDRPLLPDAFCRPQKRVPLFLDTFTYPQTAAASIREYSTW